MRASSQQKNNQVKQVGAALLVLLLWSCRQQAADIPYREVTLSFASIRCRVPAHYQLVTPTRYQKIILQAHPNAYGQQRAAQVDALLARGYLFDLYMDSANADHTLWLVDGPYVRLNNEMVREHVRTLDSNFRSQLPDPAVTVKRLESAFFNGRAAQMLKVKFQWNLGDVSSYTTEYIVTTYTRSVMVVVNHSTPEDYESLVRQMRM